jgi:hypothetical protein
LKDSEFNEFVDKYRKVFDTNSLLTEAVVSEIKHLTGGNAGLTSTCLKIIADNFKEAPYEAKCEKDVLALISKGILDDKIKELLQNRLFRTKEEIEKYIPNPNHRQMLYKALAHLIIRGPIEMEKRDTYEFKEILPMLVKLGICYAAYKTIGYKNEEYLEFTCPIVANYYQQYIISENIF